MIKAEGHSLPRAIFNEMKRKNLLAQYWSYEKLFHKAIFDIAHNDLQVPDYRIKRNCFEKNKTI